MFLIRDCYFHAGKQYFITFPMGSISHSGFLKFVTMLNCYNSHYYYYRIFHEHILLILNVLNHSDEGVQPDYVIYLYLANCGPVKVVFIKKRTRSQKFNQDD